MPARVISFPRTSILSGSHVSSAGNAGATPTVTPSKPEALEEVTSGGGWISTKKTLQTPQEPTEAERKCIKEMEKMVAKRQKNRAAAQERKEKLKRLKIEERNNRGTPFGVVTYPLSGIMKKQMKRFLLRWWIQDGNSSKKGTACK